MSRLPPSVCGVICVGDNFPEFDAAFRDTSLEFREAGEGFELGTMPVLALPLVAAYTDSSGVIDQVTFLHDKREMTSRIRALKEDNISLLCCLLKSLSSETKDRLTSDSRYQNLRKKMDVVGIYSLLEQLCVDQGSGVNSLGLIAIGFMSCSQGTLSFEKYVLKLRHTLATLDRLGAPVNETIAVSKFLLSVNTQDCSDVVGRLLASKGLSKLDDCINNILLAKQAQATMKAVRVVANSATAADSTTPVKILAVKSSADDGSNAVDADRDARRGSSTNDSTCTRISYNCCFNCGKRGHMRNQCSKPQARCRECDQMGHLAEFCRNTKMRGSSSAKLAFVYGADEDFMF